MVKHIGDDMITFDLFGVPAKLPKDDVAFRRLLQEPWIDWYVCPELGIFPPGYRETYLQFVLRKLRGLVR
jgi:hypothetical protein